MIETITMRIRYLKLIFVISLSVLSFLNPIVVIAQDTNTAPPPYTGRGVQESLTKYLCTPSNDASGQVLVNCINKVYRVGVAFGAIAVVFFVILAGYMYMTGGEGAKGSAKSMVQNALVGMGLILGSYLLLSFINPELTRFKPIQPMIFSAPDLPECEDAGLAEDCITIEPGGGYVVSKGGGGGYIACPDNVISFDKKVIPVNRGNDTEKICKALWDKLVIIHKQSPIIATATVGSGHLSKCHSSGNPKSGTCADIVPKDGNFAKLCQAIKSVGKITIVNESGGSTDACGAVKHFSTTTGAHLHIYLSNK